jgi:hypothetical protein
VRENVRWAVVLKTRVARIGRLVKMTRTWHAEDRGCVVQEFEVEVLTMRSGWKR